MSSSRRTILGPFNRVEGDLELSVSIADGRVQDAQVNSPLFRGFERILLGKSPQDALVITPRICGICSVAQSVAAARALADAQSIDMAPNGSLATSLVLATENLADHLTHFYLFFMPDFARDFYAGQPWYAAVHTRFRAQQGTASAQVLAARAQLLHISGILAGKWPHTLAIQPGGSSRAVEAQERIRLLALLRQFRHFLERTLFGDDLHAVASLSSGEALYAWAQAHSQSDFARFLSIGDALELHTLGRANDRFLSYGAYEVDNTWLFPPGSWYQGQIAPLEPNTITEDISHAWMQSPRVRARPCNGETTPTLDKPSAYSWCKAPRLAGQVMETGAIARQLLDRHPLIEDLVAQNGANVLSRVVARILELARVVPQMEAWADCLRPQEPFCQQSHLPKDADGVGLTEAARGSLGHWLRVRNGRIANYQIIAPTTWNFSPRDSQGVPGALEQALVGTPVADDDEHRLAIQHIVRSFDPCMVCTVH